MPFYGLTSIRISFFFLQGVEPRCRYFTVLFFFLALNVFFFCHFFLVEREERYYLPIYI